MFESLEVGGEGRRMGLYDRFLWDDVFVMIDYRRDGVGASCRLGGGGNLLHSFVESVERKGVWFCYFVA